MPVARFFRRFRRDQRGVAAIEMALVTSVFAVALFNAVEVGRYAYILMEVEHATQAGAQAAIVTCDVQHVPAVQNCPNLSSAVTTAIQSTSLGTKVTLDGAVDEGWYCLDATNALVLAGTVSSQATDCAAYGNPGLKSALYDLVHTTYTYAPIFPGLTIGGNFPTTIRKTAWMRMQ